MGGIYVESWVSTATLTETGELDTEIKITSISFIIQVLGTCVFPLTCSPEMRLGTIRQVLSGVVQSGCWAVLDDTDRMTKELMSVASQQLQIVTSSLRTLRYSKAYEYTTRGFPVTDKVGVNTNE